MKILPKPLGCEPWIPPPGAKTSLGKLSRNMNCGLLPTALFIPRNADEAVTKNHQLHTVIEIVSPSGFNPANMHFCQFPSVPNPTHRHVAHRRPPRRPQRFLCPKDFTLSTSHSEASTRLMTLPSWLITPEGHGSADGSAEKRDPSLGHGERVGRPKSGCNSELQALRASRLPNCSRITVP